MRDIRAPLTVVFYRNNSKMGADIFFCVLILKIEVKDKGVFMKRRTLYCLTVFF